MFKPYLTPEVQCFITEKSKEPLTKIAFQKNPFPHLDWSFLLQQIEGKQKVTQKLPFWKDAQNLLFPQKINLEQTSSEQTSLYKSEIVCGNSLIDLTGGFGVDAYFFAQKLSNVCHCEMNETLSKLVAHNFKTLNIENIDCFNGDSLEILIKTNKI
jgi:protein-L-isoaspartate O-methyltransferase